MISDDWLELCEAMNDLAEAYASVDPPNGYLYREEAQGFRGLAAPSTDGELNRLESEADAIKLAWRARFRQGKNR